MMKQYNTVVNTLIGIHTLEFIHIIKEMEHLDGPYVEQQDEDNECLRLINDSFHFWAGYFLWARSCVKRLVYQTERGPMVIPRLSRQKYGAGRICHLPQPTWPLRSAAGS